VKYISKWKTYAQQQLSKNNLLATKKMKNDVSMWNPIPNFCFDEYWPFLLLFGLIPVQDGILKIPEITGKNVIFYI